MIWQLNSISTTSRLLPTINHIAVELSRQVLKLKIYNMISEGGGLTTYQLLSSKTEVKLLLLQKAVKNLPGVDSNRTTESGRRSWPFALVGEACVSSVPSMCVIGIGTPPYHYHYHYNYHYNHNQLTVRSHRRIMCAKWAKHVSQHKSAPLSYTITIIIVIICHCHLHFFGEAIVFCLTKLWQRVLQFLANNASCWHTFKWVLLHFQISDILLNQVWTSLPLEVFQWSRCEVWSQKRRDERWTRHLMFIVMVEQFGHVERDQWRGWEKNIMTSLSGEISSENIFWEYLTRQRWKGRKEYYGRVARRSQGDQSAAT